MLGFWAGLQMTPEFSAALWNHNPDALLAIAPDGTVLHWNPAAETVFGYTAQEAQGLHY